MGLFSSKPTAASWVYCNCVGSHDQNCPNNVPGGFPPLGDDDDD